MPERLYLCFEGVRGTEALLAALFRLTQADVLWAPGVIGVEVSGMEEADRILSDPAVSGLDDMPEGYWSAEVVDRDYFRDRAEESMHRHRRGKR